ncbi:MAG TPA: hypothetical protein VN442_06360 [Bryobacteraceae bacterium]|nr:hypothetical protein [Bryobacteraceae bacterium]
MPKSSRREFLLAPAPLLCLYGAQEDRKCEVAVFQADVTPPIGEPLCNGLVRPAETIDHPLKAKGVVFRGASGVFALCAVDWVGLSNTSHDLFRRKLAEAVGTTPDRVAMQAVHQHTAPGPDDDADRILRTFKGAPRIHTVEFERTAAERIAAAAGSTRFERLTSVGMGWSAVDRVGSSRRILQPNGKTLTRYSSSRDKNGQQAPEGRIDAYLRTISLHGDGKPLAQLHYYASHPQTASDDGRVCWDVPGIARERLEKESGVFQVYFTGCAGDVAMGKYNDGSEEARAALAGRLYEAMVRSAKARAEGSVGPLSWKTAPLRFRPRSGAEYSEAANRAIVADSRKSASDRIKAAMILAFRGLLLAGRTHDVSCLHLGDIRIVHLPGEPFVEYQFWSQQQKPGLGTCVAGYGDVASGYVCTDQAYRDDGGYEQTWSFVDPCEGPLKETIRAVL